MVTEGYRNDNTQAAWSRAATCFAAERSRAAPNMAELEILCAVPPSECFALSCRRVPRNVRIALVAGRRCGGSLHSFRVTRRAFPRLVISLSAANRLLTLSTFPTTYSANMFAVIYLRTTSSDRSRSIRDFCKTEK